MLHGQVDSSSPASYALLPPDNTTSNFLFGGGLLFNKPLLGVVFDSLFHLSDEAGAN
jgi:hypothetical protein